MPDVRRSSLPDWMHDHVSRETCQQLDRYAALLEKWNKSIRLMSETDINRLWIRHIADSAQLFLHFPNKPKNFVDFGSGGGLPGIVSAILAKEHHPAMKGYLIESDRRKSVFLSECIRQLSLNVKVITDRIEKIQPFQVDVLTARALAPLPKLLEYAHAFCHSDTVLLFPKGRSADKELMQARQSWSITLKEITSRTQADGRILKITKLHRR